MISNIETIAKEKGIKTPQELCWAARMSWPTANDLWRGNLAKKRLESLHKVAIALNCKIEDLYTVVEPESVP